MPSLRRGRVRGFRSPSFILWLRTFLSHVVTSNQILNLKLRFYYFHTQMKKQEELMISMDAAIEGGYLKAPEIIALCQASNSTPTFARKTALMFFVQQVSLIPPTLVLAPTPDIPIA